MAHTHVVIDSDAHFIIDPITRAIKKEESAKVSLIVGDHNSERFSFELPRYIEGHDMSLCNVVRVHYMNTSSSKPEQQSIGVYEVDDFGIMSTDDTKMGLSWLISNNATKYVGKLAFTVQFACTTGYRVDYSWQSGIYSSISISDGIDGSEIVFDEYADILQQWWLKIYASSELPIKLYTTEEFEALNGKTESGVLYLLEDDPTPTTIEEHGNLIIDHATRISNNTNKLADHETRIGTNENQLGDHTTRIGTNENKLADHATRISTNENKLADHATRITDNERLIENHQTRITNIESFYEHGHYETIVDTFNTITKSIRSGLWLFEVYASFSSTDFPSLTVSVIMDTDCMYSQLFSLPLTNDEGEVYNYTNAKIKTSIPDGTDGSEVTLELVIPDYTLNLIGVVIRGKRLGGN